MLLIKMLLSLEFWEEDTAVGNIIKKDTTKIRGSVAPHSLIRTQKFIIIMGLQD